MKKKVSIIVPTYKRTVHMLDRAIQSLLSQSYENIEIIVVDDNAEHADYRIQNERYFKKLNNKKIIYIQNDKNLGGSLSRNVGIDIATGEYITFLDDDDRYLKEKIKEQINYMIKNDLDMSFTDLKLMNENEQVVDVRNYTYLKEFSKQYLLKKHLMRHLTGTPTFMYRSHKLREIGGFQDAKMGQEFFLMLRSIEKNLKIGYLNSCSVIAYRHNEGGISTGINKIIGEKNLYQFKQQYFDILTNEEIRFIKFRHYAVMVVAYRRNKDYINMFKNSFNMIISSPNDFVIESFSMIKKILNKK